MPYYPTTKSNQIAFKEAPSGFINIEKWVPPFVSVKGGHGFVGVLAEDVKEGLLQCHVCGKWYEQLSTHVYTAHKMDGEAYRKKFGLLMNTALKSKRIRLIQSETISRLMKEGKMNVGNKPNRNGKTYGFKKKNKESGNRKGKAKAVESQNRFGVCDLQIMTKIINLGRRLGKTPTLVDIKNEFGGALISIMHSRYGSYIKYCRDYLKMTPNFSTHNPQFGTKKKWKEHLLEVGRNALKEGKEMTIKKLLPVNESRYIYRYFKNFKDYKKQLLKTI